jgi:hypothetical protein
MSTRIKLVQGDTRPAVVISLKDQYGTAISCAGSTVRLYFKRAGSSSVLTTITGVLLTGYLNEDGTINIAEPYNVPGGGGRVSFSWPVGALDVPAGDYQGEVEITFSDGGIHTVFDVLKFKVRADF